MVVSVDGVDVVELEVKPWKLEVAVGVDDS